LNKPSIREPFRIRKVANPHRERLHQDPGFQQHVKGNSCHIQFGVDEIAPRPIQHNRKVEVAIRLVIAPRARSKHDHFRNVVGAAQLSQESQSDAARDSLFALPCIMRSHASMYHARASISNPFSGSSCPYKFATALAPDGPVEIDRAAVDDGGGVEAHARHYVLRAFDFRVGAVRARFAATRRAAASAARAHVTSSSGSSNSRSGARQNARSMVEPCFS